MLAHIFGIPVEETAAQFAPAGAATLTVIAIAGRTKLDRLRRLFRRTRVPRFGEEPPKTLDR
jgi:hypothetical protein